MRRLRLRQRAFTLVEVAVVLAIIGLLLGSLMYTLSAQTEQRARGETQRTLEQAREAILGYAVAHGRLPCPASAASMGVESPAGGGDCTNYYDGFLPAVTLGFQPVDSQGFALDAWNNRIRYAVARNLNAATCVGTSAVPHFTVKATLKQNGMSCLPNSNELLICKSSVSAPAPTPGSCGTAANVVTNANPSGSVVAMMFSPGKNFALASTAAAAAAANKPDEAANLDGNSVFISHTPAPEGATGGEFDDMMVWIPVGLFYGRLTSAGVLP
ncbi:MAG TPA: type II secretion system protein [Burkholderiales bacterium]|jgi:prepilin-type N-terminal cleavage/methylation domain-containing protein|nr:type II secretion system protein [Burkholderiales bacterium]